MTKRRYGRGTFEAHADYIKYMEMIVAHPSYTSMPGAVDDGHIIWQVSSGKTTSFNKYYQLRWNWWAKKADSLKLGGAGNSGERFSTAARLIHPSGFRPCRLCGTLRNVGYYYLNENLARRLNRLFGAAVFKRADSVEELLTQLKTRFGDDRARALLIDLFPERVKAFRKFGYKQQTFRRTNHIRSGLLSPGFMCNPPDRLDGFHDYCLNCRGKHDPGRSPENLKSYIHDRRAFEWWAEGDWFLADALYNSAGSGTCAICGKPAKEVSPDHVGPLACGFKQMPLFLPTHGRCNSSKNRRMRLEDVIHLREYEQRTGEGVAGWQVRALWRENRNRVRTDGDAKALSTAMREVQDLYLRLLHALLEGGKARFLSTLLSPEYALYDVTFEGLDRSTLTFDDVTKAPNNSNLRRSLAARGMRIAFEELDHYAAKGVKHRKLSKRFGERWDRELGKLLTFVTKIPELPYDREWDDATRRRHSRDQRELLIRGLFDKRHEAQNAYDALLKRRMSQLFDTIGHVKVVDG